jgi:drug/metabolite transporter (DMT)-like permease
MAVFLSLLTAAIYGTSDFCGGLAAQRAKLLQVVAGGHLVGLVGVVIASVLVADEFDTGDFLLGAAGGAFGAVAISLLYRRLAIGPMQVVAPVTAMTSAAVPAAWGIGSGDEISPAAWVGVALGLVAIGLVSLSAAESHAPVTGAVIVESLLAGVGFGAFFIFLDATDAASAPWPVAGARLLTVVVLIPFLVLTRRPVVARGAVALALIAVTGLLDTAANVTFLYASDHGLLTLVAVLSAMYPVATVVLARLVLSERMTRPQMWGFLTAMAATVLIAAG